MEKNIIYSSITTTTIRIISCITFIILLLTNIKIFLIDKLVVNNSFPLNTEILSFFVNTFVCILCLFLIFFPKKLGLISLISFSYSFLIFYLEPNNPMGLFMFLLGISILLIRGFFKKQKKLKTFFISFLFSVVILSELRFGYKAFIGYLIDKIAYFFVLSLLLFFIFNYYKEKRISEEKILDISNFSSLSKRDAEWLNLLLSKQSYKVIAIDNNKNIGTVKNRFKIIYDTLGVGDKTGFLNRYSDYQIIFSVSNDNPNKAKSEKRK